MWRAKAALTAASSAGWGSAWEAAPRTPRPPGGETQELLVGLRAPDLVRAEVIFPVPLETGARGAPQAQAGLVLLGDILHGAGEPDGAVIDHLRVADAAHPQARPVAADGREGEIEILAVGDGFQESRVEQRAGFFAKYSRMSCNVMACAGSMP